MRSGQIPCCDYECVAPPSASPANPCDELECGAVCSTNGATVGGGDLVSFRRRLQGFSAAVMQYCQPDGSCGMNAAPRCDNGGGASEIDPRCPPSGSDPFTVGICMYDPTCDTAGRCESQGMICCEAPCGGMSCVNPPEPNQCEQIGCDEDPCCACDNGMAMMMGCANPGICPDGREPRPAPGQCCASPNDCRDPEPRDACDGEEMCCPTGSTCMLPRGGQTRQCVMPTDGHMEAVPCVTEEGCTLTGGEEVEHGWSGDDTGSNYCNGCSCNNGAFNCTRRACQPRDACDGEEMCCPEGSTCMLPRGGQTRQCVMPTDGHMEAVPCGETSEPEGCTLRGGESVEHGWSGNDTGNNYCNSCTCNDGRLGCTKIGCEPRDACDGEEMCCPTGSTCMRPRGGQTRQCVMPTDAHAEPVPCDETTPRTCTLTGGEEVREGWSGDDTGSNHCNSCSCENGNLACTEMFCEPRDACDGEEMCCPTGSTCMLPRGGQTRQCVMPTDAHAEPVPCDEISPPQRGTCGEDLACGDVCASSQGMLMVMQYCQPDNSCDSPVVAEGDCSGGGDDDTEDLCAGNPFIGLSKRELKQHRELKSAKKVVKKHSKLTGQLEGAAEGRQRNKITKKIGKLNRNGQYDEAVVLVAQSKAAKRC